MKRMTKSGECRLNENGEKEEIRNKQESWQYQAQIVPPATSRLELGTPVGTNDRSYTGTAISTEKWSITFFQYVYGIVQLLKQK